MFLAERFDAANVDEWFERYPDEPSRVESVVNAVVLYDLFVNGDIDPYEDALPGLAADIGTCWRGVLALRHPELSIHVEVNDGTDGRFILPSLSLLFGFVRGVWPRLRATAAWFLVCLVAVSEVTGPVRGGLA